MIGEIIALNKPEGKSKLLHADSVCCYAERSLIT